MQEELKITARALPRQPFLSALEPETADFHVLLRLWTDEGCLGWDDFSWKRPQFS